MICAISDPSAIRAPGKVYPLESLRGMAAIIVALFHYPTSSWLTSNPLVRNGPLMVDLFFVLSGFVIAMNYLSRLDNWREALDFMRKRFWRLYPLHFITLILFVLVEFSKLVFEAKTGLVSTNPAFSVNNAEAFANHLLLIQAIYLDHLTFNGPSWSISAEFITYIVFAVLVLHARTYNAAAAAILVVAAGITLLVTDGMESDTDWALVRCGYSFFVGVLAFRLFNRTKTGGSQYLAIALIALSITTVYFAGLFPRVLIPWIFAAVIVQLARIPVESETSKLLSSAPLIYLGTISYSIYMTHTLVWWSVNQILRFGFGRTWDTLTPGYGTLVVLTGIIVILVLSTWTYRMVENPFRNGIPRRQHKLASPSA